MLAHHSLQNYSTKSWQRSFVAFSVVCGIVEECVTAVQYYNTGVQSRGVLGRRAGVLVQDVLEKIRTYCSWQVYSWTGDG